MNHRSKRIVIYCILVLALLTMIWSMTGRTGVSKEVKIPENVPRSVANVSVANVSVANVSVDLDESYVILNYTNPRIQRLGNQIFQFASLLGIADINNIPPVIVCNFYLRTFFEIGIPCVGKNKTKLPKENIYKEHKPAMFTRNLTLIGPHKKVLLGGYLQSWKYFDHIPAKVRGQLKFKYYIHKRAKAALKKAEEKHSLTGKAYTRIGIHIRRGDMVRAYKRGFTVANEEYIEKSMTKMRSMFPQNDSRLFIVCSDDQAWAQKTVNGSDVEFVETGSAIADLAVLSMCNATIMTTGSYGWWAAWLAGGPTIYYSNFPRVNSSLELDYNKDDYFHPKWIAM